MINAQKRMETDIHIQMTDLNSFDKSSENHEKPAKRSKNSRDQNIIKENEELKLKMRHYEGSINKCHQLEEELSWYKQQITNLKERAVQAAEEIRLAFTEKHHQELSAKIESHAEEEKRWCRVKLNLEDENYQLRQKNTELQLETDKLKENLQITKSELQSVHQSQEAEASQLREQLSNLWDEIESVRGLHQAYCNLQQELAASQQMRQELQIKIQTLESELEEVKDHRKRMEQTVNSTSQQLEECDQKRAELNDEVAKLETSLTQTMTTARTCTAQMAQLEEENLKLDAELNSLRQKQSQCRCHKINDGISQQRRRHPDVGGLMNLSTNLVPPLAPTVRQPLNSADSSSHSYTRPDRSGSIVTSDSVVSGGSSNFKEFVQAKRELAFLRSENETLKDQLLKSNNSFRLLPPLQHSQKH